VILVLVIGLTFVLSGLNTLLLFILRKEVLHMAGEQQALTDAVTKLVAAEQTEETSIAAALTDLQDIAAELNALQTGGNAIDPKAVAAATQSISDVVGRLTTTQQNIAAVVAANPNPGPQPTPAPAPVPGTPGTPGSQAPTGGQTAPKP
jgi:hypothetical protein